MFHLLAAATTFNMVCAGTYSGVYPPGPIEMVYRIDLDRGQWCEDECAVLYGGVRVDSPYLHLEGRPDAGIIISISINRATGEHRGSRPSTRLMATGQVRYTGRRIEWTGPCRQAEFTGFPEHARSTRR